MRAIAASTTFASFTLAAFAYTEASAQTYLEQNGQVVIEVEAQPATSSWQVSQAIAGYTGTSYYVWTGSNQSQGGNGLLTYQVQIQSAGNYQFLWRSRITAGSDSTEGNDTFVSLSGVPIAGQHTIGTNVWTKAYHGQLNKWSWQTATLDFNPMPIRQFFSAGLHTIRISGRSTGHGVDRFILFKYEEKPYENAHSAAGTTQEASLTAQPLSPQTGGGGNPELICFPAGESPILNGNMTTSSLFGVGDDLDADEDALTIPLLFANSATNAITGTTSDTAAYSVNLPSSGAWYAWGRFYYPDPAGVNGANSFALRVDGGTRLKFGNNGDAMQEWHYDGNGELETGAPTQLALGTLSAGNHTITVEKREVLATPPRLDVICLTNQSGSAPTDLEVCEALGGCGSTTTTTTTSTTTTTMPNSDIACVRAGAPVTTTGVMTTGTTFTNGADLDPALNNLTSPLLFVNSTTNPGSDAATFSINLPSSGTWYLWGRFYYPGTPGSNDANSFRARIGNTAAYQTFGNKLDRFRQWHWDGSSAETGAVSGLNLGSQTAGVKTITVLKREVVPIPPRLDVICATKNATTPPSDAAACSALGGC